MYQVLVMVWVPGYQISPGGLGVIQPIPPYHSLLPGNLNWRRYPYAISLIIVKQLARVGRLCMKFLRRDASMIPGKSSKHHLSFVLYTIHFAGQEIETSSRNSMASVNSVCSTWY